jgi:hypothetical protein
MISIGVGVLKIAAKFYKNILQTAPPPGRADF